MWQLFCVLYLILGDENELEDFINKPIKIYFAGYGSTFLGLNTKTHNIVARNKYTDFTKHNFEPISKIMKDGSQYEIYYSGRRICKSGSVISQCDANGAWDITRVNFGYTIGKNSSCITKDRDDTVRMKKCTETDDQIFNFKTVSDLGDCDVKDALDTNDKHKIDVNIVPMMGNEDGNVKIDAVRRISDFKNGEMGKEYKVFNKRDNKDPEGLQIADFSSI
ncbi:hypothetical protein NGRA_0524 [Nosema granulosis]|uniref:Uncharacterized protein n=1 Tax=Nosema granulosis TaxID=83296 RepID=A0A9P6L029_9MICR|nr:hypothetical protein NGRA_0524 [Nosema granulosis]